MERRFIVVFPSDDSFQREVQLNSAHHNSEPLFIIPTHLLHFQYNPPQNLPRPHMQYKSLHHSLHSFPLHILFDYLQSPHPKLGPLAHSFQIFSPFLFLLAVAAFVI